MQLLQSWKESLSIFKPANFKLFLMVTAKCVWETFKILFGRFWWLIILVLVGTVAILSLYFMLLFMIGLHADYAKIPISIQQKITVAFLTFVVSIVPCFLVCTIFLIVRPSVEMKNWIYLKKYLFSPYILCISLFFVLYYFLFFYYAGTFIFLSPTANLFISLSKLPLNRFALFQGFNNFFSLLYSPVIVFTILFFLDSVSPNLYTLFTSFLRALKLIIYNFPFCLILYLLIDVILFAALYLLLPTYGLGRHAGLSGIVYYLFLAFVAFIFYIVSICIFTNFYIKQVHDNFDLYFGKGPSETEGV